MPRRSSRRSLLRASSAAFVLPFTGCSRVFQRSSSPREYRLQSLEVVNAHDEPHELLLFVTANESARFARSIDLPAADHGSEGIESANRWWKKPVTEPAHYVVHVKVDDRPPRTHRFAPDGEATRPSVNAVVWLDRTDGQLYFETRG